MNTELSTGCINRGAVFSLQAQNPYAPPSEFRGFGPIGGGIPLALYGAEDIWIWQTISPSRTHSDTSMQIR